MVELNALTWWIELCVKEVMWWSWLLKYAPIKYLTLTLDEILMSWCHGEIVDANIYDHDEHVMDIIWLYDLTDLLMHENIIDMLMTWLKMTKVDSHSQGQSL